MLFVCPATYSQDTVYPGLELFKSGKRFQSVLDVPGVKAGMYDMV